MAVFIKCESDSKFNDGIGAIAQGQLHTYAFSVINDINFIFDGYKNIAHYQHNNFETQQFDQMWNKFFNFPNKSVSDVHLQNIELNVLDSKYACSLKNQNGNFLLHTQSWKTNSYINDNIKFVEKTNAIRSLKPNLFLDKNQKYFDNEKFNIAIHIRSANPVDTLSHEVHRENLLKTSTNEYFTYYLNLLNNIKNYLPFDTKIHIYSQGNENQFEQLTKLNYDVILHLDESPNISLYHMIYSDLFIAANSSFSYITTLLRDNPTICRDNFWHKTYDKTIHANRNGELLNNFELLKQMRKV